VEALVQSGLWVTALAVGDKYNLILVRLADRGAGGGRPCWAWPEDPTPPPLPAIGREGSFTPPFTREWLQRHEVVSVPPAASEPVTPLGAVLVILSQLERLAHPPGKQPEADLLHRIAQLAAQGSLGQFKEEVNVYSI
jgi:hypothetical protein